MALIVMVQVASPALGRLLCDLFQRLALAWGDMHGNFYGESQTITI